jgi:hypothetical protein
MATRRKRTKWILPAMQSAVEAVRNDGMGFLNTMKFSKSLDKLCKIILITSK